MPRVRLRDDVLERRRALCGEVVGRLVGGEGAIREGLDLGELEEVRDSLAGRIADARRALVERDTFEEANRALLDDMLADPAREIRRIADYVDLVPNDDRFAAALASIRREGGRATDAPRTANAP